MTMMWIALGVLVLLAIVVIVGVAMKLGKRGLSPASKAKIEEAVRLAAAQQDPVRRVMSMDTVLDLTLKELGFSGSLGDKLKTATPRIPTIQAVWEAHKLRNKLAHEHDATVNVAEADRAVRILENAIRTLIA